jgi:DNA-binding transcriptional MerR regulator
LLAVNERVKEFREDKAYLRKLLNEAREELKEASKTRPSDNSVLIRSLEARNQDLLVANERLTRLIAKEQPQAEISGRELVISGIFKDLRNEVTTNARLREQLENFLPAPPGPPGDKIIQPGGHPDLPGRHPADALVPHLQKLKTNTEVIRKMLTKAQNGEPPDVQPTSSEEAQKTAKQIDAERTENELRDKISDLAGQLAVFTDVNQQNGQLRKALDTCERSHQDPPDLIPSIVGMSNEIREEISQIVEKYYHGDPYHEPQMPADGISPWQQAAFETWPEVRLAPQLRGRAMALIWLLLDGAVLKERRWGLPSEIERGLVEFEYAMMNLVNSSGKSLSVDYKISFVPPERSSLSILQWLYSNDQI